MADRYVPYYERCPQGTPAAERRPMFIGDWLYNQVECTRCGEVVRSEHRHDFRWCKCGNIAVDGGSWYLKRCGNLDGFIERSVRYEEAHP